MPVWLEIRDNLLAYALTAAAAGVVVLPLFLLVRRRPLLPLQRQRKGRWSGGEVLLAFVLTAVMPTVAIDVLDLLGFYQVLFVKPPSHLREDLWAAPLGTLLTLAFLFWLLFSASRTRPSNLGLTRARWRQNIIVGYGSFLVLTPLVLGCYFLTLVVLHDLFDTSPQEHPLTELSKQPLTQIEWALLFFRAIVAAVVLEEVLFRGVLQGWLRRASRVGHGAVIAVTLCLGFMAFMHPLLKTVPGIPLEFVVQDNAMLAATTVGLAGTPFGLGPIDATTIVVVEIAPPPVTSPAVLGSSLAGLDFGPVLFTILMVAAYVWVVRRRDKAGASVAIFGSAMLWAAFHSMVWPTPIPLFLLGLALGFLAYRTQSLLTGMIVHGLFNTVACLSLVLSNGS